LLKVNKSVHMHDNSHRRTLFKVCTCVQRLGKTSADVIIHHTVHLV